MMLPNQVEKAEVVSRLEELFGFGYEAVQDVVMQGLLARTTCTTHHPKTVPGFYQWAETVRALRDKTVPLGWSPSDENNFPLCIHPSEKLVIAVQTGDADTGVATGMPSNRAPKGTNTEQAVWANQKQLSLFDSIPELPSISEGSGKIMWVLLYHVAPNELRFELSLPSKMSGGKIRSWQERLVFPAIPLDQNIRIGDDDGPDFEVEVERRS